MPYSLAAWVCAALKMKAESMLDVRDALSFAPGWVSYVRRGGAAAEASYLLQPGYLAQLPIIEEDGGDEEPPLGMSVQEARCWCDARRPCAGFSLSVAVSHARITSRSDDES